MSGNEDRYRVQALARGLAVLTCFTVEHPRRRMTDIAEETGIALPTVFRLVRTLVGEGYLEELPDGTFRPALAVMQLGFAAVTGLDVVQAADGRLRSLAGRSQETVNLAVREDDSIVYLLRIKNRDLVTADLQVGSRLPVQSSSMGKLLLAYAPGDERETILSNLDLSHGQGPNAIATPEALRDELTKIRRRGWSYQDQELAHGLRSIAAPIFDGTGEVVAAINMAVAAHRYSLDELVDRFLEDLLLTARTISMSLGHYAPPQSSPEAPDDPRAAAADLPPSA